MSRLTKHKDKQRRKFDFRVHQRMRGGQVKISTHLTAEDAERGRNPIKNETNAEHAAHYRVIYGFRTLVGPGKHDMPTIVRIDASDRSYPFREPTAWVVEGQGGVLPWSPHFLSRVPVCLGSIWEKNGQVLMGHLVIHIARLLNWDEQLDEGYSGYNGRAVKWWRKNINRPLDPNLVYPSLPLDELYGEPVIKNSGGFRPTASQKLQIEYAHTGGFRPIGR